MQIRAIMLAGLFVLCAAGLGWGQSISLDHVDGLNATGGLEMGVPVTFHIRVTGDADNHSGVTNGFVVSSSTGAQWGTIVGDTTGTLGKAQFDGGFFISYFSNDGMGADTIGFGGFKLFSTGLPAGFDDVAYTIQIGPIDAAYNGGEICLDSTFYPPTSIWKWAGPDIFPGWDGPHCYTVGVAVSNPEITCPDDTSIFLCDPGVVCFPFEVVDAEWVTASEPAYVDGGQVCLPIEQSGEFVVTLIAGAGAVADTCSFTIGAELNQPPSVTMVPDSIDYVICDLSGTICMAFSLTDPNDNIVDTSSNIGFIDVSESVTYVCFSPGAEGLFDVTVVATDECGASNLTTRRVNVIEGEAAVVLCPGNIIDTLCGAQTVCFPVTISPDTANVTVLPSGSWDARTGLVCVPVEESGVIDIAIIAQTECGVDSCHVLMDMTVVEPVAIDCPDQPVVATICENDIVCVPLKIESADSVHTSNGTWADGELCFRADSVGVYDFTVTAFNFCGQETCELTVEVISDCSDVTVDIDVDTMHVIEANALPPRTLNIYLRVLSQEYTASDIVGSSILVNSAIIPDSAVIPDGLISDQDDLLVVYLPLSKFIQYYSPVWDTLTTTYTVTGRFADGEPFTATNEITLLGHLSGDVNLDGIVDISDLIYLIDYQFQGGPAPRDLGTADLDKNNILDISDLMLLIDYMFSL